MLISRQVNPAVSNACKATAGSRKSCNRPAMLGTVPNKTNLKLVNIYREVKIKKNFSITLVK